MSGIYLHIPFCKQACSYCDFYFVTRSEHREQYLDTLVREIESYQDTRFTSEPVQTIYIGGGTPSLMDPGNYEKVFSALEKTFLLDLQEVTLEMNPDDVNKEYLQSLRDLGINRASMGVQTFQPELLNFMNRAHDREEALRSLELLQQGGFDTFTVDLIYGNPGQSLEKLESDLEILTAFNPPHVSAYSLTIESKTRLGKQVELGRIDPPDDDQVADHLDLVISMLEDAGIRQYEVSNFSRPGKEAIHNSNYWRHKNYLGLGPAAHSFWWDEEGAIRWENDRDLKGYLDAPSDIRSKKENLTAHQLAEERIMLALRTKWGISREELRAKYGYELTREQVEYLEQKEEQGKVKINGHIRLTREGMKIADAIILDFVTLH